MVALFHFIIIGSIVTCCLADADKNVALMSKINSLPDKVKAETEVIGTIGSKAFFGDVSRQSVDFAGYIQFCQGMGMQTAEIDSAEEHEVIINHITSDQGHEFYWIGGWDVNYEFNDYHWITGRNLTFKDGWLQTEDQIYPRVNQTLNYNCIAYSTIGWTDRSCDASNYSSLCQLTV